MRLTRSILILLLLLSAGAPLHAQHRPRARALGVVPGTLAPGRHNAITDVAGVLVGHATARAIIGLGRTGRRHPRAERHSSAELGNDAMSPLFQAVAEATEEAIYNSLFTATTERAGGKIVEALPVDAVLEILRRRGALR